MKEIRVGKGVSSFSKWGTRVVTAGIAGQVCGHSTLEEALAYARDYRRAHGPCRIVRV